MTAPQTAETRFQRRFLLSLVLLVSLVFFWMIRDFAITLVVAALAAGLARAPYRALAGVLGGRDGLAAGLVVLGTLLLVIGPLVGLLGMVAGQALEVAHSVTPWVQAQIDDPDQLTRAARRLPFFDSLEAVLPDREKLLEGAAKAVRGLSSTLVGGVAAAGALTARFFLQLFIFLYSMFFFLIGGRAILDQILYYAPLDEDDEALVMERFLSVTRATLKGSLVIGAIQGLLAGLAFWACGIQGAAFWGTIMMVLSVIPGIGAPLIWVPAVLYLYASGSAIPATLLLVWCGGLVGSIDNVLRPRLVGGDAKMSDLLILLSTLGGITLFGAVGFVLGPIVAAVFVTLWEVYGRAFADYLPPVPERSAESG